MHRYCHAALAAGIAISSLAVGLQKPADARVSIKLTRRTFRPTSLSRLGGPVNIAYVVKVQGATLATVHAQATLSRGGSSAATPLRRGANGLYSGQVIIPGNRAGFTNRASVYLILTTTRGVRYTRLVGSVSVAPADESLPPPPPR